MIYSTAKDLARWSQALYGGDVLTQESLEQMVTFHHPTPGEPWSGYGLGTAEFRLGGIEMWGHLGWQYGYMAAMLYLPDHSASIAVLINDNDQGSITSVALGLWLVVQFHLSTVCFVAVLYAVLLYPSMVVVWPGGYLAARLRAWKRNEAVPRTKQPRGARIARAVACLAGVTFFAAIFVHLGYSLNPQGPLKWFNSTPLVKVLLVIANLSLVLSVAFVVCCAKAWKERYWSIAGRIYYTLVAIAALCGAYLLHLSGLLVL
jgi:hypothetical protein